MKSWPQRDTCTSMFTVAFWKNQDMKTSYKFFDRWNVMWWHTGGGGLVAKSCPTLATPRTVDSQAPLPMGFPRQEYWSGLPFSSPRYLSNPGIKGAPPALLMVSCLQMKSLLQHYSSKASILWLSAFFMVQLSHPYMTTGKTIALARCSFVAK